MSLLNVCQKNSLHSSFLTNRAPCSKELIGKVSLIALGILMIGAALTAYFVGPQLAPSIFSVAKNKILILSLMGGGGGLSLLLGLALLKKSSPPKIPESRENPNPILPEVVPPSSSETSSQVKTPELKPEEITLKADLNALKETLKKFSFESYLLYIDKTYTLLSTYCAANHLDNKQTPFYLIQWLNHQKLPSEVSSESHVMESCVFTRQLALYFINVLSNMTLTPKQSFDLEMLVIASQYLQHAQIDPSSNAEFSCRTILESVFFVKSYLLNIENPDPDQNALTEEEEVSLLLLNISKFVTPLREQTLDTWAKELQKESKVESLSNTLLNCSPNTDSFSKAKENLSKEIQRLYAQFNSKCALNPGEAGFVPLHLLSFLRNEKVFTSYELSKKELECFKDFAALPNSGEVLANTYLDEFFEYYVTKSGQLISHPTVKTQTAILELMEKHYPLRKNIEEIFALKKEIAALNSQLQPLNQNDPKHRSLAYHLTKKQSELEEKQQKFKHKVEDICRNQPNFTQERFQAYISTLEAIFREVKTATLPQKNCAEIVQTLEKEFNVQRVMVVTEFENGWAKTRSASSISTLICDKLNDWLNSSEGEEALSIFNQIHLLLREFSQHGGQFELRSDLDQLKKKINQFSFENYSTYIKKVYQHISRFCKTDARYSDVTFYLIQWLKYQRLPLEVSPPANGPMRSSVVTLELADYFITVLWNMRLSPEQDSDLQKLIKMRKEHQEALIAHFSQQPAHIKVSYETKLDSVFFPVPDLEKETYSESEEISILLANINTVYTRLLRWQNLNTWLIESRNALTAKSLSFYNSPDKSHSSKERSELLKEIQSTYEHFHTQCANDNEEVVPMHMLSLLDWLHTQTTPLFFKYYDPVYSDEQFGDFMDFAALPNAAERFATCFVDNLAKETLGFSEAYSAAIKATGEAILEEMKNRRSRNEEH